MAKLERANGSISPETYSEYERAGVKTVDDMIALRNSPESISPADYKAFSAAGVTSISQIVNVMKNPKINKKNRNGNSVRTPEQIAHLTQLANEAKRNHMVNEDDFVNYAIRYYKVGKVEAKDIYKKLKEFWS